jgi:hypothetical protein
MEIIFDEAAYYQACATFYEEMATKYREKAGRVSSQCQRLLIPQREMPPMQYNMESFYLSLLYYLARTVVSVEELNALIRQLNALGSSSFIFEQLNIWESLVSKYIYHQAYCWIDLMIVEIYKFSAKRRAA